MIRVLIADDNPVILVGLEALLSSHDAIDVVATADNGRDAVRAADEHSPDVVLLDVRMPLMDGIETAERLSDTAQVLMLTYSDTDDVIVRAIQAGASGYLVHGRFDPGELVDAVRTVATGGTVLSPAVAPTVFSALRTRTEFVPVDPVQGVTPREREIMTLISQGLANREIAAELFVTEKTVKNHVNNIYSKLGVRTRAEAISLWLGTRPGTGTATSRGAHDRPAHH